MKRLVAARMARDAIPPGGGFAAGVAFLLDPDRIGRVAREATAWAEQAVKLVRDAPGANPWRSADDEAIAGEVMRQLDARKRK